jgi:cytochrome c peroxidase
VETLRDVVVHYNNGGVTNEGDPVNPFLSGGIRPLNLTENQIDDLVAFMEALTSSDLAPQQARTAGDDGAARVANDAGADNDTRGESDS